MRMIERVALSVAVREALARSPAVALVGPRQVGKTTLARTLLAVDSPQWFDLEDPQVEAQLAEPLVALRDLRGLVVIDEIQHAPDLFKVLRVLIDRPGVPARFLLLGSASPALLRQSSESLAGRIEIIEIGGFTLDETGFASAPALWLRGGFPVRSQRPMMPAAPSGDASSSARQSSAICRNSASTSLPRRFTGSGRCWPTITARCGTRRSLPDRWASTRAPCGATSTC